MVIGKTYMPLGYYGDLEVIDSQHRRFNPNGGNRDMTIVDGDRIPKPIPKHFKPKVLSWEIELSCLGKAKKALPRLNQRKSIPKPYQIDN